MLSNHESVRLTEVSEALRALRQKPSPRSISDARRYYHLLRASVALYEDVVRRCLREGVELCGTEYESLRRIAGDALLGLCGQGYSAPVSLRDYDHRRYGPFLGVSDDGGAVDAIAAAALCSPKMTVLGPSDPIEVGVALDAERLGAVGEVAVGPAEYREIRLGCIGRILTSTNVGTRLNLRYFKQRPRIKIPRSGSVEAIARRAQDQAARLLQPFLQTPDGRPRPVTVFVHFATGSRRRWRLEVLEALKQAFAAASFCAPEVHHLGLLTLVRRSTIGGKAAQSAIDLAREAGLREVAVQGVVRREAEERISMPGLLNFFTPRQATSLLAYAADRGVHLTSWNLVDPDTVARNVWAPLQVARSMGLELGKYGLSPLTVEEADAVMGRVQAWFRDWTAAPVLYVDLPIVGPTEVYEESTIIGGIEQWLEVVARRAIPVVLIDTADKSKGRRLLQRSPSDKLGILALEEIERVGSFAENLGVKVLWAGGLSPADCYELGKLQAFGLYVTTSVAASRPLTERYRHDPMLASEKHPTFEGVSRVKLLIESGFLVSRLKELAQPGRAHGLEEACFELLRSLEAPSQPDPGSVRSKQDQVAALATGGWPLVLGRPPSAC